MGYAGQRTEAKMMSLTHCQAARYSQQNMQVMATTPSMAIQSQALTIVVFDCTGHAPSREEQIEKAELHVGHFCSQM